MMKSYQTEIRNLFNNACLASSYYYIAVNGHFDWIECTEKILEGIKKGYLGEDAYVGSPVSFFGLCGVHCKDILKKKGMPPRDDKAYAVQYTLEGKNHFVVVRNKEVIYDPWGYSDCVKFGIPVDYREIIYE